MEVRKYDHEEIWGILSRSLNLYNRYLILSDACITSPLPCIKTEVLPLSWVFQEDKKHLLKHPCFCREEDWYCFIVNGVLSLHLTKRFYTECGLQCKKLRDKRDPRDWYVFKYDLCNVTPSSTLTKLRYCFTNVLSYDYEWRFFCKDTVNFSLNVSIKRDCCDTEELLTIIESVGAQTLDIPDGSNESFTNSFSCTRSDSDSVTKVYSAETVMTLSEFISSLSELEKKDVVFLHFSELPMFSNTNKHIVCYFVHDGVYLLQYDVRG